MIKMLLFDPKSQTPGVVSHATMARGSVVRIEWYPNGYEEKYYLESLAVERILEHWYAAETHPYFQEHGFPPGYTSTRMEIKNKLFEFMTRYGNGEDCVEAATDYVMELIDDDQ